VQKKDAKRTGVQKTVEKDVSLYVKKIKKEKNSYILNRDQ